MFSIKFALISVLLCGLKFCYADVGGHNGKDSVTGNVVSKRDDYTQDDARWRQNCWPSAKPGFLCMKALNEMGFYGVFEAEKDKFVWSGKGHCKFVVPQLPFCARTD